MVQPALRDEEIGRAIGAKSMQAPSGKIIEGSPNVTINGLAASRVGDQESCDGGEIAQDSGTVFVNGMPAARVGDKVTCGATIVGGSRNVFIGGATVTRLPVHSEVSEAARFAAVVIGILPALGDLARATASAFAEIKAAGFARAAQIGVKALGRAIEARGTPKPFAYSPKRLGETEPGAVQNNAKLQSEMDAAATARARKAEEYPKLTAPADEYPELPAAKAATCGDDVRPWNGDDHEGPIRRVIGSDRDANGGYWQAEIPSNEAEWRGGSAVLNDWNGNGGYVESSPKGLRGWTRESLIESEGRTIRQSRRKLVR